jgi:hypothetical protein
VVSAAEVVDVVVKVVVVASFADNVDEGSGSPRGQTIHTPNASTITIRPVTSRPNISTVKIRDRTRSVKGGDPVRETVGYRA